MKPGTLRRLVATLVCTAPLAAGAAAQVVASPLPPGYGDTVKLELRNSWPAYLPATRYVRAGNSIVAEFEYMSGAFTASRLSASGFKL